MRSLLLFLVFFSAPRLYSGETEYLGLIARMWGFLKYHHPHVASGKVDWDQALLHALEALKTDSIDNAIDTLIQKAGPLSSTPAVDQIKLPAWTQHEALSPEIISYLYDVAHARRSPFNHFLLSSRNRFNENPYPSTTVPDEAHRLLALFRYWNVIHFFFPFKDQMPLDWEPVLESMIPRFVAADQMMTYQLTVAELVVMIDDAHAGCNSDFLAAYLGTGRLPFTLEPVPEGYVIARVLNIDEAGGVASGDLLKAINGTSIPTLICRFSQFIPTSDDGLMQFRICRYLTAGPEESVNLELNRNGVDFQTIATRLPQSVRRQLLHQRTVPTWRLLEGNIGYMDLSAITEEERENAIRAFEATSGMILDLREYPRISHRALLDHFLPKRSKAFYFRVPDQKSPGTFQTRFKELGPHKPNPHPYQGRIVILVDAGTTSSGEFHAQRLSTVENAFIVGSPSGGGNGMLARLPLPGGIQASFTWIGSFYLDGRSAQRIMPHMIVRPTLESIRSGRDRLLEKAMVFLLTAPKPGDGLQ